jgi:hypothetical protein
MEVSQPLALLSTAFTSFLSSLSSLGLLSRDPLLQWLQLFLLALAFVLVFLVFFVTRDILHRTRSLPLQLLCIFLVSILPVVGFFLYLLMRPRQTLEERGVLLTLERLEERLYALEEKLEKLVQRPSLSSLQELRAVMKKGKRMRGREASHPAVANDAATQEREPALLSPSPHLSSSPIDEAQPLRSHQSLTPDT